MTSRPLKTAPGFPQPFGISFRDEGINFSLHSKGATEIFLMLFDYETQEKIGELSLDPAVNRTGNVWHILVHQLPEKVCYAYRLNKTKGKHRTVYNSELLLLDPYAKGTTARQEWGKYQEPYRPLGIVMPKNPFDWSDDKPLQIPKKELVLYEMQVRGFTHHHSSGVKNPGTFLGIVEKIPYLLDLGINAVKLMPIQEWNECAYERYNPLNGQRLHNYWGYSTVNFYAPMKRFATHAGLGAAITEFKTLVRELHKNGIAVILDVVFNHTAENDEKGPTLSFKGIDFSVYYMLDHQYRMVNFTGCGNTFNCNHPVVREFIRSCLQYWVTEMHVDGFRFDLAAIMTRGLHGEPLSNPPLIEELSNDPILAQTILIAEPWDLGLYMLGAFYPIEDRWMEWNDKYRDSLRRFIKGDHGGKREFANRICGSQDLFGDQRTPCASVNFITAHDGFTLRDLVSYNEKHNSANAEENRDGNPNNTSWNCGAEGETEDKGILKLRQRQMRNFHLALMVSIGTPMIMMGNEYAHTRFGNNNSWCQDNELNWFLWDELEKNQDFYRFYKSMIHFRRRHSILQRKQYLTDQDIEWHGLKPFDPDWYGSYQFLAFILKDNIEERHFYAAFNMHNEDVDAALPDPPPGKKWHLIANTAASPPEDFFEEGNAPVIEGAFHLIFHSTILLEAW